MDTPTALDQLPPTYARALRLLDTGATDQEIGDELRVPRESVGPLLRVAVEKLVALIENRGDDAKDVR